MNIKGMRDVEIIEMAYAVARNMNYRRDMYIWRLGKETAKALQVEFKHEEAVTLFGVPVEFDAVNPWTLKLYKDVTFCTLEVKNEQKTCEKDEDNG